MTLSIKFTKQMTYILLLFNSIVKKKIPLQVLSFTSYYSIIIGWCANVVFSIKKLYPHHEITSYLN